MIELLCLITNGNDDKNLKELESKYNLPFNLAMYGKGTASSSLLNYFGLEEIRKYVYFSLLSYSEKKDILNDIHTFLNLDKPGTGIAFTIPLSSSTKYINNNLTNKSKEVTMKNKEKGKQYELVVAIVNESYGEIVMDSAKNKGAGGGTLLKGRSLLKNSKKNQFLGITIEPEKDIILIVTDNINKKDIMNVITENVGLKTKGNGIVFSMPIDDAIGLYE